MHVLVRILKIGQRLTRNNEGRKEHHVPEVIRTIRTGEGSNQRDQRIYWKMTYYTLHSMDVLLYKFVVLEFKTIFLLLTLCYRRVTVREQIRTY